LAVEVVDGGPGEQEGAEDPARRRGEHERYSTESGSIRRNFV
jgi:hypothetical protein